MGHINKSYIELPNHENDSPAHVGSISSLTTGVDRHPSHVADLGFGMGTNCEESNWKQLDFPGHGGWRGAGPRPPGNAVRREGPQASSPICHRVDGGETSLWVADSSIGSSLDHLQTGKVARRRNTIVATPPALGGGG
jgi:hypothetical protein